MWEHVERAAPGLLASAARDCGVSLWRDPDDPPTPRERRVVLEGALRLMRGNRSTSCATYFSPEGELRFVQPFSSENVGPHARDDVVLDRVQHAITRGVPGRA